MGKNERKQESNGILKKNQKTVKSHKKQKMKDKETVDQQKNTKKDPQTELLFSPSCKETEEQISVPQDDSDGQMKAEKNTASKKSKENKDKKQKIKKEKPPIMKIVSAGIVRYRFIIMGLFGLAMIYSVMCIGKVQVNSDMTAFLPEETETRQGITVMADEFITYASADVMVSNITYETAEKIAAEIEKLEHVDSVSLDDTRVHYVNSSALLSISFNGTDNDLEVIDDMNSIREMLRDYDTYISSDIGVNKSEEIASQMGGVLILTVAVIVAVLLFTSRSYFEVVIFGIVFGVAGLLNMGTNFWLGEISSITNSIAVILQLALAIDYSIIFSHRYQDEALRYPTAREALIEALSKSIIEISSSSLTTISGLLALTLMQFRLGYDLGMVLTKGIILSLLTVFLLMPGLIMFFPKMLKKTAHRSLVPDIRPWGRLLMCSRYCFVWLFVAIIPFSVVFSSQASYAFDDTSIDELIYSESRAAMHKITDTFDNSTTIAVIVPNGNYNNEKEILKEIAALDNIKNTTGLANIEIEQGRVLTDNYTPRMFAELLDIDIEQALLLYQAYGVEHEQYQGIFQNGEEYEVTLLDMFLYLFDMIDRGLISLNDSQQAAIDEKRGTLTMGIDQLQGENYDRLVVTATVPVEGEKSVELVESIRTIAEKYYGDGNVLVVGEITSARDLGNSYTGDNTKINLLTIAFILIILLLTFKSVAGGLLLVFVIQGSIWINFSFLFLTGTTCSFVTNMIVSALQMGATIDDAIVIMNHYLEHRQKLSKKDAMILAVNESFPTILTSGSILTVAGFVISFMVSDVYIGHIGLAIGRGALISVILVLTVLPQFIVMFDGLIEKTRFKISLGGEKE